MSFKVWFNGCELPSYIRVQSVDTSVLPSLSHTLKNVTGAIGAIRTGFTIGEKEFSLKIKIVPEEGKSLSETMRDFAGWLTSSRFMQGDLRFSDNLEVVYSAYVKDAVDITDDIYVGSGTLKFVAPLGYGIGKSVTGSATLTAGGNLFVKYNGTAPSYPILTWTPTVSVGQEYVYIRIGSTACVLAGGLTAGQLVTIDMKNRKVTVNGTTAMDKVTLDSKWFNFPSKGDYYIVVSHAGTYSLTYTENWF